MSRDTALSRRTVLFGMAAALTCAGLPRVARAGEQRVLILGGSSMRGALGKRLETELSALGYTTKRHARSASGLARSDFYDWFAAAEKAASGFSPTATILQFGGNDGQSMFMGEDASPKWIRWDEEGWAAEYGRRVEALSELLSPGGSARVVWMGMPNMRSNKLDGRMATINAIVRETAEARSDARYVSTRGVLSERFAQSIKRDGAEVQIRAKDGIHFSQEGATLLAKALTDTLVDAIG